MEEEKKVEVDENTTTIKTFLNKKKYPEKECDSNCSSSSNSYLFQVKEGEDSIIFEKKHISNFSEFMKNISNIPSPCSYEIKKSEPLGKKIKEEKAQIKISKSFFDDINSENIKFFDFNQVKKEKDDTNEIIYFSSSILKAQYDKDVQLFDKLHYYLTGFSGQSLISDFCFDQKLYFPFAINDYYIGYDRDFSHIFRYHHYYRSFGYGKIIHNFGPKGVGKSICCRATVFNYLHFIKLNGEDVFFPAIFFDIKVLLNNWNNKNLLLKIIKYEFMNLFENPIKWKNSYSEFENQLKKSPPSSVFMLIIKFSEFYFTISKSPVLIVIDHYSKIYDKDNEIKELKDICINQKKFILYIFYEVNTIEDQKLFIEFLQKPKSVMHEIRCEKGNINNQVDLSLTEVACFFGYELRGLPAIIEKIKETKKKEEMKKGKISEMTNEIHNFIKNIPKKYVCYFGNNISYYFKYLSYGNQNFEEFIKNEKIEIRKNILTFLESDNSVALKGSYEILKDILKYVYKELDANFYLLNFINSSYFLFHRINSKGGLKYKYTFAFPLIKDIIREILKMTDTNYFIDINSLEFEKLDGVTMGIFFDKFINNFIKKNIVNSGFMEFSKDDIQTFEIKYLIKNNLSISELCSKSFAEEEIDSTNELMNLEIPIDINKKKCIVIFQAFNAKSIDICFLIKRNDNNENNNFSLNSLQMKCSDSFSINSELLRNNRYEMTHLKYKLEYLFKINITESYITYLSIYDIPKKCAENNRNRFFYFARKNYCFVDEYNNKINKFPFYKDCKIEFVFIDDILIFIKNFISHIYPDLKMKLKVADKKKVEKEGKQINNSVIVEIKNDIIIENIIIKNMIYNFKPKNVNGFETNILYFVIQFEN